VAYSIHQPAVLTEDSNLSRSWKDKTFFG
jgi:hypothetical protein